VTAWGVVAVCGIGGGAAGPFLDAFARRVRRAAPPVELPMRAEVPTGEAVETDAAAGPLAGAAAGPGADLVTGIVADESTDTARREPATGIVPSRGAAVAEGVVVALVTAAACALCAVRLGAVPQLAAYCVLAGALVIVSVTDLRTGLVPRRVVYVASVLVGGALLAASATNGTWHPMLDALIGAAAGFFVFAAVWWISPKAMGFGDVRLAGLCGGALGWLGVVPLYLGFLAGFVAGTLMGLVVLLMRGRHRFPFAPALALGTMFGVLWGAWLGNVWLHIN
jgi:leader peptidase (prepilin peptidase)/N-methyltransferase